MLWSTVHAAAWARGCEDGRRWRSRPRQTRRQSRPPHEPQPFPSEDGVVVVPGVAAETTTGGKEALAR